MSQPARCGASARVWPPAWKAIRSALDFKQADTRLLRRRFTPPAGTNCRLPGAEMCGRFALKLPPAALKDYFDLDGTPDFGPRYNIAPTTPILAIRQVEGVRRADPLRWGLISHWAKDEKIGIRGTTMRG